MVLAAFVLSGGLDYGIQRLVIMPSYVALEREEAEKNAQRFVEAINRELQLLSPSVADWAYWDETYRFAVERNADYIETNLPESALSNLKVNLLNIYGLDGERLFGQAVEPNSKETLNLGELSDPRLPADHPLLRHPEITSEVAGIIDTLQGPLLVAARPILTSTGQGPGRGVLMMGRLLNDAEFRRIAEQNRLKLGVFPAAGAAPEVAWPQASPIPHTPIRLEETAAALRAYTTIGDLFGRPLLTLQVETPRAITAQGEKAVRLALLSIAGAGLLVTGVLLAMLHWTVLNPVGKLTAHAIRMGAEGDLRSRLALSRNDELGVLAREFDRMTERLAEARRRLIDQSYQDGIAEMARGVLHNIGNAITPLGVRLATLDEELRAAPVAEMELAVAELASAETPTERRNDLACFVELAGGELARLVTRNREQVAAITQQVGRVRQILADQERYSRASRVLEPVAMAEVVHDAARMLAPPMREAMAVMVEPSLREVGEVTASRVVLQQVVGNLLVNAAESMLDSGVTGGRMVARAVRELFEGRPVAHFYFEDNGGGISSENLTRIFEQGFSTKGRGSGLGLHWSANTVTALNGRMYVESAGLGAGACMHLILPLAVRETMAAPGPGE